MRDVEDVFGRGNPAPTVLHQIFACGERAVELARFSAPKPSPTEDVT